MTIKNILNEIKAFFQKRSQIILIVLVTVGLFYWFQWRPMKIREQCAMPELYTDPVPALTQSDIDTAIAAYNKCHTTQSAYSDFLSNPAGLPPPFSALLKPPFYCPITSPNGEKGSHLLTAVPHPAIPAKPYFVQATPAEYSACLHIHGI